MRIKKFLDSILGNCLIKSLFAVTYYWTIPLVWRLFYWVFIYFPVIVIKEKYLFAVTLGFVFATIRSCWKKARKTPPESKNFWDLLPSYLINYPIVLSFIVIMGSYYFGIKTPILPDEVSFAALFVLGFLADIVFDRLINFLYRFT